GGGIEGVERKSPRPADPPRRARRCRRTGGSRQQPGVRDGGGSGDVRAQESRRRGRAPGRRGRLRTCGRTAAYVAQGVGLMEDRMADNIVFLLWARFVLLVVCGALVALYLWIGYRSHRAG